MFTHVNVLTKEIVGAAIEVHRHLGPGLLESAYQRCLARELQLKNIPYQYEWPFPLDYKGLRLKCGYRVDLWLRMRSLSRRSRSKRLLRCMRRSC
jgi:GxxExxY protein